MNPHALDLHAGPVVISQGIRPHTAGLHLDLNGNGVKDQRKEE